MAAKEAPANVPAVGSEAPDFELRADDGSTVRLSDLRGQRVVLYFYPADDTPGCTTQACGFRDNYVEIQEKNALVLGISPDDMDSHVKFKTKFNLPFRLLADPDHKVAELYGAWGEKNNFGKKYMGIIRSHFVVDENGKIADVQYSVSPVDSVQNALAALRLN
jgi:peroxiredoxin Q/BCP